MIWLISIIIIAIVFCALDIGWVAVSFLEND